ncbi:MAG: PfkB family carbohydrate kinase, partial [Segatella oris]
MNKKIVTFGEILFRLSKENHFRLPQGHVFNGDFGGSEANVAVSLAVMGDQVEYVTRVPDNAIGHASLMHLREFGLDVKHVV